MIIESEKTVVNATQEEVYLFLSNAENIELLLPKDEIKEFKGASTECSFKVQGGITISLVQHELIPNEKIIMRSGEKSPFPFKLNVFMDNVEGGTEGYIVFDGEVNAFLKMMVKKPLTNLFNHMTNSLGNQFS
jgi:carbon monoxide dehydrogenase subunit G